MAVLVVFVTTYVLILPAITIDQDTAATDPAINMDASAEEQVESAFQEDTEEVGNDREETLGESARTEEADEKTGAEEAGTESEGSEESETLGTELAEPEESATPEPTTEAQTKAGADDHQEKTSAEKGNSAKASFEAEDYTITVSWDKTADIASDVTLNYTELIPQKREHPADYDYVNEEYYNGYMDGTLYAIQKDMGEDVAIQDVRFLDLTLLHAGEKIIPADPVKVTIEYKKPVKLEENTAVKAVHFDATKKEPVILPVEVTCKKDASGEEIPDMIQKISFETTEISFYAITYVQNESKETNDEAPEAMAEFPAITFSDSSENVMVNVTAEEGTFPAGTTMEVAEADAEEVASAAEEVVDGAIRKVEAVDITFRNAAGEEIQPAKPIQVSLRPKRVQATQDATVVHMDENGSVDVVESEAQGSRITFEADSFSVYAIVYTVDFEYSVNGKMYQFSLLGGGFVSFTDLVEVLGIIDDTNAGENEDENGSVITENAEENAVEIVGTVDENATNEEAEENGVHSDTNTSLTLGDVVVSDASKKFVADVESVEFSDPELVWVGKIDEATTVGDIKEAHGLECEYSAELTEEKIAEIDSSTVEADDWALISVRPFTSEETLTVTMKNGEQFVVRVTDAQISTHVMTADGKDYVITVTYGPEAGIPDGAVLTARELLPGTEEYEKYYTQAVDSLRADVDQNESVDLKNDDEIVEELKEYGLEAVNINAENDIQFSRFFDITILVDGEELEPEAPVTVSIQYNESIEAGVNAEAQIVHFAEDGVEVIKPDTIADKQDQEAISAFVFEQSSFSITATMLNYTKNVTDGKYVIIKGTKDANDNAHYYAMHSNGTSVEITKKDNNLSNIPDDCSWTFTRQSDGNYVINNNSYYSWLTLYNNVTGNWDQHIKIEPMGKNTGVAFRNPGTNQALRWNGNNNSYYISTNGNAETFYIARVNSDIGNGQGYNLKPTVETELGDLLNIQDKINDSKIIVDKSASVYDYDNRIYKIDLKALSDVTILLNKIDLELIVDTSRSMYFPANMYPVNNAVFNKIEGTDQYSLTEVVKNLDKSKVYYFIGEGEKATVFALYYAASGTNLNDHSNAQQWRYVDASYMNPPDAGSMNQSDVINRLSGRNIEDFNLSFNLNDRNGTVSRLYTSPDGYSRLSYLKEAVRIASEIVYALDKNNRTGLVTFNSKANNPKFYDNGSKNGLYSAISNISLAGGTRQDLGLEAGINLFNSSGRPNVQKIAILITDGAPNMRDDNGAQVPSDTAWSWIAQDASALKGTNSSNAKLYTLGLSLDMVGGNNQRHLDGLASEEDGVTRHFNASNGPAIASAIKDLIDTLVYDVTLEAEVTDVLDPAFYPVDQNGNPISAGDYTDDNGKRY
ncbi:MAG: VWA domain-containing protein, partial [Lachnospiraceae bacterium]|nr:VWA domain-containing protein [Lachnospiraceae bacterium]